MGLTQIIFVCKFISKIDLPPSLFENTIISLSNTNQGSKHGGASPWGMQEVSKSWHFRYNYNWTEKLGALALDN